MSSPDRLTELEIRIAHLEASLEQLSDELALQQQRHQDLLLQMDALKDRVATQEAGDAPEGPEPPPPHY